MIRPKTPKEWVPLRDIFQQKQAAEGGNMALAFIAALDELDERMNATSRHVVSNGEVLGVLGQWYKAVNRTLEAMPADLADAANAGLKQAMPDLTRHVEEKAKAGAADGATPQQGVLSALRHAVAQYHTLTAKARAIALVGLPIAFCGAILGGFLFGSLVIPALPPSWQWTCQIIGADYVPTENGKPAVCLIRRK